MKNNVAINELLGIKNALTEKIAIYIPSTVNVNEKVDTSKYIDECATLLSELFGGATAQNVTGFWNSETQGLVKEDITIVYSYASIEQITVETMKQLINFCKKMKEELSQEAISFEYNGKLIFQ